MNIESREKLAEEFSKLGYRIGAEIGVLSGGFSDHILSHWNGILISIDRWKVSNDGGIDLTSVDDLRYAGCYQMCKDRLARFTGRSIVLIQDSLNAHQNYPNGFFDFIYLDTCHNRDHVIVEMNTWWDKIRTGGMFCGHDYNDPGNQGFTVHEAVHEFCNKKKLKFYVTGEPDNLSRSWVIPKDSFK
jgi:hypothetical protein